MEHSDILIIGAGVCGMAAARELAKQGKRVVILEAASRTGGRVNTFQWHFQKTEAGPEFIHGNLPLTKKLVDEARGRYVPYEADMFRSKAGRISKAEDFVPHMQKVLKAFQSLEQDCTLSEFFDTHFTGDEHRELRLAVIRQAEGFDVADPKRVSVFALREEWSHGHEDTCVIREGYSVLTDHLAKSCRKGGVLILLAKEVNSIHWQKDAVAVQCDDGSVYGASRLIVTVSLGMLTAPPGSKGHIRFSPEIPQLLDAAQQMGFGSVVKVLLAFRTRFWLSDTFREQQGSLHDFGFLISDGTFPVFWTGNEDHFPVLTAWAGGPRAQHLQQFHDRQLFELAMGSLAHAFGCSEALLKSYLLDHTVFNWSNAPYVRGAYSYNTVHTEAAKERFGSPLLHTLYFAGEAFGDTMGTVEAALESAAEVVKRLS